MLNNCTSQQGVTKEGRKNIFANFDMLGNPTVVTIECFALNSVGLLRQIPNAI